MKIFKDELDRLKRLSSEDDNASLSSFEDLPTYENEPIIEKGPFKTPTKPVKKENRGLLSLFKTKTEEEKQEETQPRFLHGQIHSEPTPPKGNALSLSTGKEERTLTPFQKVGTSEEELRKNLLKLDKPTLRGLYRTITGTDPPPAMKEHKIVKELIANHREATARNYSVIKDVTGGGGRAI